MSKHPQVFMTKQEFKQKLEAVGCAPSFDAAGDLNTPALTKPHIRSG